MYDNLLVLLAFMFFVCSTVVSLIVFSRRNKVSFLCACKVLWYEGFVSGYKEMAQDLLKALKAFPTVVKKFAARWYDPFCRWLEDYRRQHRTRFQWGYDLECEFRRVLTDYAYNIFEPYINAYCGIPGVIQIQYITKTVATGESVQECLEHIVSKFRHFMTSYGLNYPFFPYYMINGSEVSIFILYCEYAQELPDFYKVINKVIMTKTESSFGALKECHISKDNDDELILGYDGDKWKNGGIVAPYIWKYKKDPALLYAGHTGAGKSFASKFLILQLLKQHKDIYICDFKAGKDFEGIFKSNKRYAEYKDCGRLFNEFYDSFVKALETKVYEESFLIFDEINSYTLSLDSKERKEFLSKLSHIAFMGRSANKHLIIISQQFNAEVLPTAIREQFATRIYMGNKISNENKNMLYPGVELPATILPNYNGFICLPQVEIGVIAIPEFTDPKQLDRDLQILGHKYYD